MRKQVVVLSGAGISAESGIQTFRGSDGLWNGYRIEEVATPEAWHRDPKMVLDFYDMRRKRLLEVEPNAAHYALVELESKFDVTIITQNIDNLHERAGSSQVLHLHGELTKARSTMDSDLVYDVDGWRLDPDARCEKGSPLRPHIVWFGEAVPAMEYAMPLMHDADIVVVVGTSLIVYPAAGLLDIAPLDCSIYLVDLKEPAHSRGGVQFIGEKASVGVPRLVEELLESDG